MNIKRLRLFLTDQTIRPGYYAKEGTKFIEFKLGIIGARAGMKVVRVEGKNLFLWDSQSKLEFKLPMREVKKSTLVRLEEEKHGT